MLICNFAVKHFMSKLNKEEINEVRLAGDFISAIRKLKIFAEIRFREFSELTVLIFFAGTNFCEIVQNSRDSQNLIPRKIYSFVIWYIKLLRTKSKM